MGKRKELALCSRGYFGCSIIALLPTQWYVIWCNSQDVNNIHGLLQETEFFRRSGESQQIFHSKPKIKTTFLFAVFSGWPRDARLTVLTVYRRPALSLTRRCRLAQWWRDRGCLWAACWRRSDWTQPWCWGTFPLWRAAPAGWTTERWIWAHNDTLRDPSQIIILYLATHDLWGFSNVSQRNCW